MLTLVIFLALFNVCNFVKWSYQSDNLLFLGKYVSPINTTGIININSTEAIPQFLFPVLLRGVLDDSVRVINNGKSIEYDLNQSPRKTHSGLSGGPGGLNRYTYGKVRIYWTDDIGGTAGTTIDGKGGTTLEAVGYFYNMKYGLFNIAKEKQDGLIALSYRIHVSGFFDNKLFDTFEKILEKIRYAGNSTMTTLNEAFKWYNFFPPINTYYTYPSSYTDEPSGKTYSSVTMIILPTYDFMRISIQQFKRSFAKLKNFQGEPLVNKALQSQIKRPVVRSSTVIQYFVPSEKFFF